MFFQLIQEVSYDHLLMMGHFLLTTDSEVNNVVEVHVRESEFYLIYYL